MLPDSIKKEQGWLTPLEAPANTGDFASNGVNTNPELLIPLLIIQQSFLNLVLESFVIGQLRAFLLNHSN